MPAGRKLKWPTPESRQSLWKNFCDHVRQGYTMGSFPEADEDTLWSYSEKFPEDCPMEDLKAAQRASLKLLEGIGLDGTQGLIKNFNPRSWEFIMQNKAKWSQKIENTNKTIQIEIIQPVGLVQKLDS